MLKLKPSHQTLIRVSAMEYLGRASRTSDRKEYTGYGLLRVTIRAELLSLVVDVQAN